MGLTYHEDFHDTIPTRPSPLITEQAHAFRANQGADVPDDQDAARDRDYDSDDQIARDMLIVRWIIGAIVVAYVLAFAAAFVR